MKKIITCCFIACCFHLNGHAQDMIFLKDGTEVKTKVLEVDKSEVKYKRFDNIDGPIYTAKKNTIVKIKYENGVEDIFTGPVLRQLEQMKHKPQNKVRYAGLVEFGQASGADVRNGDFAWGSSLTTAHGVKIDERYFVGVGVGLNIDYLTAYKDKYIALPIYATTQIDFPQSDHTIFLAASLGAQIGLQSEKNKEQSTNTTHYGNNPNGASAGLWTNCMVGVRWKNNLYVSAGPTVRTAYNTVNPGDYAAVGVILTVGIRF